MKKTALAWLPAAAVMAAGLVLMCANRPQSITQSEIESAREAWRTNTVTNNVPVLAGP